jgi:1-acyl-sn-glycerol-3-phosphate acyltransferase
VQNYLAAETLKALGIQSAGWWYRLTRLALRRRSKAWRALATEFDRRVAAQGFQEAARWAAATLSSVRSPAEGVKKIPTEGPLLIASNHPGAFDSLAIIAGLPRRDTGVVLAATPFFRVFRHARRHFIYSTLDPYTRMAVLRSAVRHLQAGGALVIFATGKLDPDPAYYLEEAQRSIKRWSSSLAFMLRKVPETRLVPVAAGNFVAQSCLRSPLAHLRRAPADRQRLAEFLQVIQQLILGWWFGNVPRLAFGPAMMLGTYLLNISGVVGDCHLPRFFEKIPWNARCLRQRRWNAPDSPGGAAIAGGQLPVELAPESYPDQYSPCARKRPQPAWQRGLLMLRRPINVFAPFENQRGQINDRLLRQRPASGLSPRRHDRAGHAVGNCAEDGQVGALRVPQAPQRWRNAPFSRHAMTGSAVLPKQLAAAPGFALHRSTGGGQDHDQQARVWRWRNEQDGRQRRVLFELFPGQDVGHDGVDLLGFQHAAFAKAESGHRSPRFAIRDGALDALSAQADAHTPEGIIQVAAIAVLGVQPGALGDGVACDG